MSQDGIFLIVIGAVLVLLGWMELAYAKLMRFKREARQSWLRVAALLQTRGEAVLSLLAFLDSRGIRVPEMEALYDSGGGFVRSEDRDRQMEAAGESAELLSALLSRPGVKEALETEAGRQLLEELAETEETLSLSAERFNENIRRHNEIIGMKKYRLQIRILKPSPLKEFHPESRI